MRLGGKVAIAVLTYRNPGYLAGLLENMKWAGLPDVPLYIFEDPSPFEDRQEISASYREVAKRFCFPISTAPKWGCMQGLTELAMQETTEDWIIWVPDDVRFCPGGLWNEVAGVMAYGRRWVGGIQAPYWNAHDLVEMGLMTHKEQMFDGWQPDAVPPNPHWNYKGMPRAYVNLNGAGFSISRDLWYNMGGFPKITWRLDEYAGYQAWHHGMTIITLPGPPRVHYFGGSTAKIPEGYAFHTEEAWVVALGKSVADATAEIYGQMHKLPGGLWHEMARFFLDGGKLL